MAKVYDMALDDAANKPLADIVKEMGQRARCSPAPLAGLLANVNFPNQFNAICSVQPLPKKQFPSRPPQISTINPAVSSLTRGGSRSSRTRGGMRWTRQRQAREGVRRAVIREWTRRAGRTALKRTAKPCGPGTRGWCQAVGGEFDPTGSICHQAGSDGGKTNSSPGRARHKPSNHCAGNAGVPRLYLYARVRISLQHCTRDRGCSKHPAFPAPSFWREGIPANLGRKSRREKVKSCLRTSTQTNSLDQAKNRASVK